MDQLKKCFGVCVGHNSQFRIFETAQVCERLQWLLSLQDNRDVMCTM